MGQIRGKAPAMTLIAVYTSEGCTDDATPKCYSRQTCLWSVSAGAPIMGRASPRRLTTRARWRKPGWKVPRRRGVVEYHAELGQAVEQLGIV